MPPETIAEDASEAQQSIPLQQASLDIWDKKYRLKDKNAQPIDAKLSSTLERVARALADVESQRSDYWYSQFLWALQNGAIPAGRILSNAGAQAYKPATSTINCTVSGVIKDSMHDILEKNLEAGLTLKSGCGIGYEFSTLRPKGAYVSGAGALTSGPLSFMDIFDKMCFTVSSAGGRRGAQMATFDVYHPDVMDFIRAKREDGRLRQFNFSLLICDDFIQAVKSDGQWPLSFPLSEKDLLHQKIDLNDQGKVVWRDVPNGSEYIQNQCGEVACKVYRVIRARRLWDMIMASTFEFAEPGFILIDEVNKMNNNWFCEQIRATNPCGEQPLPPYGSCLLGSINLTSFVDHPFTAKAQFNWQRYRKVIAVFTRMLDNVVEINGLSLSEQREEIKSKRRHGMGFLGLGSTFSLLGMVYGGVESIAFTEQVAKELAQTGWKVGVELAKEKGSAPLFEKEFTLDAAMLRKRPEMLQDGFKLGDKVSGKVLLAKYSRYMQKFADESPELLQDIEKFGCRFTHHSSIAPTGTISLSLANNASNGIEPSFAHFYSRNVIREGRKSKEKIDVYSYEFLAYCTLVNPKARPEDVPDYFSISDSIDPKRHVDVQAAAQKWVDSSISKTINVPTNIDYQRFKGIYLYAYDKGLKGCTTFRFNPENFQGVLVRDRDLENTIYRFELEDGSSLEVKGSEEVVYEGEKHSAANLYDALKEGYFGKL